MYAIDQLPRTHAEAYTMTHKLAQSAHKGSAIKAPARAPDTAPFLADTRYLLAVVIAPQGAPLFRWQEPAHHVNFVAERASALEQWRTKATPTLTRLMPGCGIEVLLPEAYYVACREADKLVRPVSIRAAVHYLTNVLGVEAADLRAVIAAFGEEVADGQVDEYRVSFTLRQTADVVYGIVWPLYGPGRRRRHADERPAAGRARQRAGAGDAGRRDHRAPEGSGRQPRETHRRALLWPSTATIAARRCLPIQVANWCMRRCRKIHRKAMSIFIDVRARTPIAIKPHRDPSLRRAPACKPATQERHLTTAKTAP